MFPWRSDLTPWAFSGNDVVLDDVEPAVGLWCFEEYFPSLLCLPGVPGADLESVAQCQGVQERARVNQPNQEHCLYSIF